MSSDFDSVLRRINRIVIEIFVNFLLKRHLTNFFLKKLIFVHMEISRHRVKQKSIPIWATQTHILKVFLRSQLHLFFECARKTKLRKHVSHVTFSYYANCKISAALGALF